MAMPPLDSHRRQEMLDDIEVKANSAAQEHPSDHAPPLPSAPNPSGRATPRMDSLKDDLQEINFSLQQIGGKFDFGEIRAAI